MSKYYTICEKPVKIQILSKRGEDQSRWGKIITDGLNAKQIWHRWDGFTEIYFRKEDIDAVTGVVRASERDVAELQKALGIVNEANTLRNWMTRCIYDEVEHQTDFTKKLKELHDEYNKTVLRVRSSVIEKCTQEALEGGRNPAAVTVAAKKVRTTEKRVGGFGFLADEAMDITLRDLE